MFRSGNLVSCKLGTETGLPNDTEGTTAFEPFSSWSLGQLAEISHGKVGLTVSNVLSIQKVLFMPYNS